MKLAVGGRGPEVDLVVKKAWHILMPKKLQKCSIAGVQGGRGPEVDLVGEEGLAHSVWTIGIVSDTHGVFDENLRILFAGVDEIWHAGDHAGRIHGYFRGAASGII